MTRWIPFLLLALSISAAAASVPRPRTRTCSAIPAGLVGWWTFDATESLADRGPHGVAGRALGGTQGAEGRVGGAIQLGPDGRFVVGHHAGLELAEGFTVELWIRTTDSLGARALVRKTAGEAGRVRGFALRLVDGKPELELAGESSASFRAPTFVADGRWHHLAVSVDRADAAGIRFYVDGDPGAPAGPAPPRVPLSDLGPFVIGYAEGGEPAARATLDEPSIYSRALLRTEIVGIWAAGADGKCRGE